MEKKRKYSVEAGLNVFTAYKTIIPVEALKDFSEKDKHKYYLYSILAFDQFYFNPDKTKKSDKGICMSVFCVRDGLKVEYDLPIWPWSEGLDESGIEIKIVFPFTYFELEIIDDNFLKSHPDASSRKSKVYAQYVYECCAEQLVDYHEYQVLYIGQAFGKEGERTAFDRLEAHSTLQKILTDLPEKYPTKHVYILLMVINANLNMSFDGISNQFSRNEVESEKHMHDVISDLPRENQIINITEAALINFFKPEYNVNFVENFPIPTHKGYRQYYDLDYNALTVELDLEFEDYPTMHLNTCCKSIKSSFDFIRYNLFNDDKRKDMYDIFSQLET